MRKLSVDIWSDVACPWCFVGKRRLEAALAQLPAAQRADVEVKWHAFELDPKAPREFNPAESHAARIAKKYGISEAQAEASAENLKATAKADGIEFDFERILSGNTFDAHRLIRLGAEHGLQDAVKERFLRGYFSEGAAIGQPEALERLAVEAGLDAAEVHAVLTSDRFASEVRADENEARELGVNGVPFFVLDKRFAISGAQPTAVFLGALQRAFAERAPEAIGFEEGATCGPEGC